MKLILRLLFLCIIGYIILLLLWKFTIGGVSAFYEDYRIINYDNNESCMRVINDQKACDKALGSYTGTTTQFETWKPKTPYVISGYAYDSDNPEPINLYLTAEESQKNHDDFVFLKTGQEPTTITIGGIAYDKATIEDFLKTLSPVK